MKPKIIQTQIDSDGVLQLNIPVSPEEAKQKVEVTIKPMAERKKWSQDFFTEVLGQWEGEFPTVKGVWPYPDRESTATDSVQES